MNIAILGNNKLSIEVTKIILDDHDVCPLVVLNDNDRGLEENRFSLKKYAKERNLFTIQPTSINIQTALESLGKFNPDLLISCSYAKILKEPVINLVKNRCVNFHFSLLPKYRGCLPIIYALANGDNPVGVTMHHISPGIDSGDIIDQIPVALDDFSTNEEAYYKCVDSALVLFKKWWPRLKHWNNIPHIIQNVNEGSYNKQVFPYDRWIDWNWSAGKVVNLVNALTNGSYPAARAMSRDGEVELLGKAIAVKAKGKPGLVLESSLERIVVACGTDAMQFPRTRNVTNAVILKKNDVLTSKSDFQRVTQ
jgi:methionyl-tRNA formyltransferase